MFLGDGRIRRSQYLSARPLAVKKLPQKAGMRSQTGNFFEPAVQSDVGTALQSANPSRQYPNTTSFPTFATAQLTVSGHSCTSADGCQQNGQWHMPCEILRAASAASSRALLFINW
jgi:hypothetical protein